MKMGPTKLKFELVEDFCTMHSCNPTPKFIFSIFNCSEVTKQRNITTNIFWKLRQLSSWQIAEIMKADINESVIFLLKCCRRRFCCHYCLAVDLTSIMGLKSFCSVRRYKITIVELGVWYRQPDG